MNCMSSMEIILLVMAFLLGGLWDMETEAMSVTGELGKDIEIKCSHTNAFTNDKYFCKEACKNQDILISSRNKDSNRKYSIRAEGNTFYVTIFDLTKEDSGTYWCGIDRVGLDTYNKVILTVIEGLWDMETEAMSVTGELGRDIEIKCSHTNAFTNDKYFCKEACKNQDILISSRNKDSNRKYSIRAEGNTFYVTIFDLTKEDSGTYWCGIDRVGLDTYNKVILTVIEGNTKDPDNDTILSNSSKKLVYIGAGLGVVVLALAIVLLMFFRHRKRHIGTSSGKDQDTVYATPSIQKQDAHTDINTSSSTANEDQETDGRTNSIFTSSAVQHQDTSRDHTDNIYSNVSVSSESQIQPDSLFYSTVSFNTDTDCSTHTATVTYSTVRQESTDESTVYCNV